MNVIPNTISISILWEPFCVSVYIYTNFSELWVCYNSFYLMLKRKKKKPKPFAKVISKQQKENQTILWLDTAFPVNIF